MPKLIVSILVFALASTLTQDLWLVLLILVVALPTIWFKKLSKLSLIIALVCMIGASVILVWPYEFWLAYVWPAMSAALVLSIASILPLIIHHEK